MQDDDLLWLQEQIRELRNEIHKMKHPGRVRVSSTEDDDIRKVLEMKTLDDVERFLS
jgi:hypothetical protein